MSAAAAGRGKGALSGVEASRARFHERPKEVERPQEWQRNWQRDGPELAGDQREPVVLGSAVN